MIFVRDRHVVCAPAELVFTWRSSMPVNVVTTTLCVRIIFVDYCFHRSVLRVKKNVKKIKQRDPIAS